MLGLASPGPKYRVYSDFDKHTHSPVYPSWGQPSTPAMKIGRERAAEVQYMGKRHTVTLRGHFSPGPQYMLPSTIGFSDRQPWTAYAKTDPQGTGSMPYTKHHQLFTLRDIGNVERPATVQHRPYTAPEPEPDPERMRAFWSKATVVRHAKPNSPLATWHADAQRENPSFLRDLEAEVKRTPLLATRPKRNSLSPHGDPPFASTFGRANRATEDFDNRATSYIAGYGAPTTWFGPPHRKGGGRVGVQSWSGSW